MAKLRVLVENSSVEDVTILVNVFYEHESVVSSEMDRSRER